jgi:tight adherence protein B
MDLSTIGVALFAAAGAGAVAYALIYPYLSGEIRGEKRQAQVVQAAARTTRTSRDRSQEVATRRKQVGDSLKELEAKQKAQTKVSLDKRIAQAGLKISRTNFIAVSVALGITMGLGLFLFNTDQTMSLVMGGLGLVVGGLGLPNWYLSFLRKARIKKFIEELPNAMDVIVRGIKSGLPLGDCLRIIAAESAEPLRSEFKTIVETQTLGVPVGDACAQLFERIPVTEANFFGIVIQIQTKAGGNLSEALGNLSKVLRARRQMKAKVMAMSTEATASAAIIASLPFIVTILVYLSSPKYIELLWITTTGKLVVAASLFWMFLGVMTMRKMINFEL